MKLTFESNLNYQQDAIKSITDLFEGIHTSNCIYI
jgi:type III restriction enzyme